MHHRGDVDRTLLGCREHVQSGTKPVLEPDATYVSLFTERTGVNGVKEVPRIRCRKASGI